MSSELHNLQTLLAMAGKDVYQASTTAPVNIAVIK